MIKRIVIVLIFMYTAITPGNAGIYTGKAIDYGGNAGGIYSNISDNSEGKNSGYGIYKSFASSPGNRPGIGDAIGQEQEDAPLGDGLTVLVVCSAILLIAKEIANKFKR